MKHACKNRATLSGRFLVFLVPSRGKKSVVERECFPATDQYHNLSVSSHPPRFPPLPFALLFKESRRNHVDFSPSLSFDRIPSKLSNRFTLLFEIRHSWGQRGISNEPIVLELSRSWRESIRNAKASWVVAVRTIQWTRKITLSLQLSRFYGTVVGNFPSFREIPRHSKFGYGMGSSCDWVSKIVKKEISVILVRS